MNTTRKDFIMSAAALASAVGLDANAFAAEPANPW